MEGFRLSGAFIALYGGEVGQSGGVEHLFLGEYRRMHAYGKRKGVRRPSVNANRFATIVNEPQLSIKGGALHVVNHHRGKAGAQVGNNAVQ
jgi:hypothetical protein